MVMLVIVQMISHVNNPVFFLRKLDKDKSRRALKLKAAGLSVIATQSALASLKSEPASSTLRAAVPPSPPPPPPVTTDTQTLTARVPEVPAAALDGLVVQSEA